MADPRTRLPSWCDADNEQAVSAIRRRIDEMCRTGAFHLDNDTIDDLLSECLVRALRKFDLSLAREGDATGYDPSYSCPEAAAFARFAVSCANYVVRERGKRRRPVYFAEFDEDALSVSGPQQVEDIDLLDLVADLRQHLSADQVALCALLESGRTRAEIAAELGISVVAAYKRIERLEAALYDLLYDRTDSSRERAPPEAPTVDPTCEP